MDVLIAMLEFMTKADFNETEFQKVQSEIEKLKKHMQVDGDGHDSGENVNFHTKTKLKIKS